MSDARDQIGAALSGALTPEQLEVLMTEVLAITKQGRGWCPTCKKSVIVEVADAKAVTGAIVDLANQSWGRPEVVSASDEGVSFTRKVVYGSGKDEVDASDTSV